MKRLVECVPNFSEGRRIVVIQEIEDALASVAGVAILDRHIDPDHNRSVITLAGNPDQMHASVLAGVRVATERIDLTEHVGQHPRVGATDVIPWVPLRGLSMTGCADLAAGVGTAINRTLGIPVYLYGAAARTPNRQRLETIRNIGFERLRTEIVNRADLQPDCGRPQLHPTAGATFVGARKPLIAFNINLESSDPKIARSIAAKIRESGGGLPGVKALGLFMETSGASQVSMNLTDYTKVGLATVFQAVLRHAEAVGVSIRDSELVGLAPAEAFQGVDPAVLKIAGFGPGMILERRLEEVGL